MNERIKEIADESGLYIAYDNRAVTDKEIEFFAELIVRECISTMASEIVYNDNYKEKNNTISDMMELLKQHFGVEE